MRDKKITVRATAEESESIKKKAKVAGMSISQYLIKAGLSRKIEPPIPLDIRKSIAGFGRNLNQLTYHSNATGTAAEVEAVERLKEDAQKIISAIAELKR
jgi:uncharacterized protein (DUF1778 family)